MTTPFVLITSHRIEPDRIDEIHYSGAESEYPGAPTAYAAPVAQPVSGTAAVGATEVEIELPPGHRIRLDLRITVRANQARHSTATIKGAS